MRKSLSSVSILFPVPALPVVFALILVATQATPACAEQIFVEHSGSTDPSTEGFPRVAGSPVSGAWNVTGLWCCSVNWWFPTALQLSQLSEATNWELTATIANLSADTGAGACCGPNTFGSGVAIALGNTRFDLNLSSDGLGDQVLSLDPFDGAPNYTIAGLGTDYVTLALLYSNTTHTADAFVDGARVITGFSGDSDFVNPNRVGFAAEDGNFSEVELVANVPESVPEPTTAALLAVVVALVLLRSCFSRNAVFQRHATSHRGVVPPRFLKLIVLSLSAGALLNTVRPAHADPFGCSLLSGNLIQNCDFQGGVHTLTSDGNIQNYVPNLWTPNDAYVRYASENFLSSWYVCAGCGDVDVVFGNYTRYPTASLSQTFSDRAGLAYAGSVYILAASGGTNDPLGRFQTLIDGSPVITLDDTAPALWKQYTFSFVGTGSDTITLEGATNTNYWFVDDVVVDASSAPAPEPAPALLVCIGLLLPLLQRVRTRPGSA